MVTEIKVWLHTEYGYRNISMVTYRIKGRDRKITLTVEPVAIHLLFFLSFFLLFFFYFFFLFFFLLLTV